MDAGIGPFDDPDFRNVTLKEIAARGASDQFPICMPALAERGLAGGALVKICVPRLSTVIRIWLLTGSQTMTAA